MKRLLLLALLSVAAAAESLTQPPPLIRIIQSSGPPASNDVPTVDVANGIFLFGMTAITGFAETWFMETHSSFAGLEEWDRRNGFYRGRNAGGEDSV